MKRPWKMLLAGVVACTWGWPNYAWAQSAIWAGGSGNWFGNSASWDCVSGAVVSPCSAPNGSSWSPTIGTMLNGSSFTGSVTASAPVNLGLLAVGTGATGNLTVSTAGSGSTTTQITVGSQGTITVNGGATLSSSLRTDDSGSITVTGTGSQWVVNETLNVGTGGGNGTLTISRERRCDRAYCLPA